LLGGPVRGGRGAVYTAEHAERLREIRKLQERGLALAEIGVELQSGGRAPRAPEPTAWWQYGVSDDVIISVRGGVSPWRLRRIRAAIADLAARLEADSTAAPRIPNIKNEPED
jgi:DNA-binding transcriptional MerR regulator